MRAVNEVSRASRDKQAKVNCLEFKRPTYNITMITDSFYSTAAWMQVQAALTKPGATNIVLALLVVFIVALAADYTHMLYLHYRMVSIASNEVLKIVLKR